MTEIVRISEETDYVVSPGGELFVLFQGELLPLDPDDDEKEYYGAAAIIWPDRIKRRGREETSRPVCNSVIL
jgi:hypothetical protein